MSYRAISTLAAACAVLLAACGGGGGGTAGGSGITVSGAVVKGPVLGATVCVYAIAAGAKGAQIPVTAAAGAAGSVSGGCYVTPADGSYLFTLPQGASGDILLESTGGSFCTDENPIVGNACAGAARIDLGAEVLSSVVALPAAGASATIYTTPLTTAAVGAAAGAGFGAVAFNTHFDTLAGLVIGAGITPATAPSAANQPYLAQVANFMQGGGTLASAVGSLQQGVVPGAGNVPATVNQALVGTHSLKFYKGGGEGCGSICPFSEAQDVVVTVHADGRLSLPHKELSNPFYRSYGGAPHLPEAIWLDADAGVEYALSDNENGSFNEINVGDAARPQGPFATPTFLGQIRAAQGSGGGGGVIGLAAPFDFPSGADDDAVMTVMAGEYAVAIVSAPTAAQTGPGTVVVGYAGSSGAVSLTLKDASGAILVTRTAPALTDRSCADGRCVQFFDNAVGHAVGGRRIGLYNYFDAGNTNASTAYANLLFYASGSLAGQIGDYGVRNGVYAFGADVPAQFASLAGTYAGTAQQLLCVPNPVTVEIGAGGSIRMVGKSSVSCEAQDMTAQWDGIDDFVVAEPDGQIVLKLDSAKIGGSQPGGGITLKLASGNAPDAFTEARLTLGGAAGDVTTVNAERH